MSPARGKLAEYRKKRDFRKTPEPAGDGPARPPARRFVIQKHDATRLHYDFRLELDGVLKSWAVPKGPNLDPAVKSLAVHVEDHPLDYADFEGVIPKGEYGGGPVIVWDEGEWIPAGDPVKAYRKGHLKFRLEGRKLGGGWSLVRMGGKAGEDGKNWLLMKSRDDRAVAGRKGEIVRRQPESVKSGRKVEEVERAPDRVWTGKSRSAADVAKLPGARRRKMPAALSPMLATLSETAPEGDEWLHELKYDGYRILAFLESGRVRLVSRNGKDWTTRFGEIAKAVGALPVDAAVFDGEIVVLRPDGRPDFQALQNALDAGRTVPLVYYVFDLPWCSGRDLTGAPLKRRKEALSALVGSGEDGAIRFSGHVAGHGPAVLDEACRLGIEGIVSKRADSKYATRRTKDWRKAKCMKRQEFVIGGFTPPSGSRKHFGSLLLGTYAGDDLVFRGSVGTGFTDRSLAEIAARLKEIATPKSPFSGKVERRGSAAAKWVRPRLVAEVEFAEWTSDGRVRHPSFKGLREDKDPRVVVKEEPDNAGRISSRRAAKTAPRAAGAPRGPVVRVRPKAGGIEVEGVRISNPGRVLYPEMGLTKEALARYYVAVADVFVPAVAGRPLTLVRCPQGREAKCFYQKHLTDAMPHALRGVEIAEKEGKGLYVVADDLAGVLSLVNLGVLEFHVWGSRADDVERPDLLVMDLDPAEDLPFPEVVRAALELRDVLAGLDLLSFVRTTGGKGLHVVVPLVRRAGWAEVKDFARGLAEGLVRRDPDRYHAVAAKAKRRGKIFVDYLRNGRGATAIASYSTRARSGATVATPLSWDELSPGLDSAKFHVGSIPDRLAGLSGDPWEGFAKTRQSITKARAKAVAALR